MRAMSTEIESSDSIEWRARRSPPRPARPGSPPSRAGRAGRSGNPPEPLSPAVAAGLLVDAAQCLGGALALLLRGRAYDLVLAGDGAGPLGARVGDDAGDIARAGFRGFEGFGEQRAEPLEPLLERIGSRAELRDHRLGLGAERLAELLGVGRQSRTELLGLGTDNRADLLGLGVQIAHQPVDRLAAVVERFLDLDVALVDQAGGFHQGAAMRLELLGQSRDLAQHVRRQGVERLDVLVDLNAGD